MGLCASRRSPSLERFYELDTPAVELGKGMCSRVFRARSRATGALVAVKRLDKEQLRLHDEDPLQWEREVALLRRCASHPNVVALHDVLETPDFVYIIMELAEGGELFQALIDEGAYSEWDARRYITDLLEALRFLHGLGIAHRDVKPENLLLTSASTKRASIKLADFGLASLVEESTLLTQGRMTWAYCAPEIFSTAKSSTMADSDSLPQAARHPGVGVEGDMWSVGIVLYVLLSGIHPFDPDGRQTRDQMINNIQLGQFSMNGPRWDAVSQEVKALILSLLKVDPEKRPSAVEALSHEWFLSPRTSRESLIVSISDTEGLAQYCYMMRRKFRSSVFAAVAADTLRRSINKSRQPAGSIAEDKEGAAVQIMSDDSEISRGVINAEDTLHTGLVSPCVSSPASTSATVVAVSSDTGAQPQVKPSQSVLSHIFQHAPQEEDDEETALRTAQPSVNTEDIAVQVQPQN
ncbi:hypothetical protein PHYBOEH_011636 [Phytophthora boehmeriae]|uniref:Protein kinase domain-containing protein n=1 Tax=Phytophthora boehmeriae TaxID=109152 RepID=A0A8T1X656_9STRA|nr:hypothetical protein PHYBOEH_011636 [Phytophthora boehmeriae]